MLFLSSVASSQACQPIYADNFESYPPGSYLAQESPLWSPWFGFLYEEAVISADQSLDDYEFATLSYPVPLSDYTVYALILLIIVFTVFRFRKNF
ncbi:MAG: hypothetical protein U5Q03_00520 [Bacteroidota bacterium]|nr:hypothetical protein [Bacteroidota bacterium]